MIFEKRRLFSKTKEDRIAGYYLNLLLISVSIYATIIALFQNEVSFSAKFGLAVAVFLLFVSYGATKGYDIKSKHQGSCEWLIAKINPSQNIIDEERLLNIIHPTVFIILLFCVMGIISSSADNFKYGYLLIAPGAIGFLTLTFIITGLPNSAKVSEKEILLVNDLIDLELDDKIRVKAKMAEIVREKGFVRRSEFIDELRDVLSKYRYVDDEEGGKIFMSERAFKNKLMTEDYSNLLEDTRKGQ